MTKLLIGVSAAFSIIAYAHAQNLSPAVNQALQAFVHCGKLAALDEYVYGPTRSAYARAEAALNACYTEENAYFYQLAASLGALGNADNSAVLLARSITAQARIKIKSLLVNDFLDWEIKAAKSPK